MGVAPILSKQFAKTNPSIHCYSISGNSGDTFKQTGYFINEVKVAYLKLANFIDKIKNLQQ